MTQTLRLSFSLLSLLFFFNSYSQNVKQRRYISLSAGAAFPVGKYASTNLNKVNAGFAKTGEVMNISYTQLLSEKFGFVIAAYGQRNGVNTRALENDFSKAVIYNNPPSNFNYDPNTGLPVGGPTPSGNTYSNWKFDKHTWLFGSLMAGGYGEFLLKKTDLALLVKATAGVVYAVHPKLNGNSISDTTAVHVESNSKHTFGAGYAVSAGIRYDLNKKLCLLTTLEYLGTSVLKFKDMTSTFTTVRKVNSGGLGGTSTSVASFTGTAEQTISSVNFHVGIGLRL
jgi:hypothetical protein